MPIMVYIRKVASQTTSGSSSSELCRSWRLTTPIPHCDIPYMMRLVKHWETAWRHTLIDQRGLIRLAGSINEPHCVSLSIAVQVLQTDGLSPATKSINTTGGKSAIVRWLS